MANRISRHLEQWATGPVTLFFLVIFLVFTLTAVPMEAKRGEPFRALAGSPDTTLFYTSENLYDMAEQYGEAGRRWYIQSRLVFDAAWPLVYGVFFIVALGWCNQRAWLAGSVLRQTNLIPVLAIILDYFENASAAIVMHRYPDQTPFLDSLVPVFTLGKWFCIAAALGALLMAGLKMFGDSFSKR